MSHIQIISFIVQRFTTLPTKTHLLM